MTAGDIIIFMIVALLVVLSSYVLYRDRHNGGGCSGNCGCCSGNGCTQAQLIEITDEVKKN